jgi:hypothetical protein
MFRIQPFRMQKQASPPQRQTDVSGPVRIAIVGCGAIGASTHIPAALRSSKVRLTALVDTSQENLDEAARRFAVPAVKTTRLEEAFPLVDGILIATPNHTHYALAAKAIEAKIPVLIEKPLTKPQRRDSACANWRTVMAFSSPWGTGHDIIRVFNS